MDGCFNQTLLIMNRIKHLLPEKVNSLTFNAGGIKNMTPQAALQLCTEGAVMIDVRENYLNSYKKFAVPVIFEIPLPILEQHIADFNHEDIYIFADSAGIRSKEAVQIMQKAGFSNVYNLAGGLVDWERQNLPLVTDISEMLSGSCACQLKYRNINKKS